MTVELALGWDGIVGKIGLAVVFVMWFTLTVFILCVMEVSHQSNLMIFCLSSCSQYVIFFRVCLHSCMLYVCTGSKQIASTLRAVDM